MGARARKQNRKQEQAEAKAKEEDALGDARVYRKAAARNLAIASLINLSLARFCSAAWPSASGQACRLEFAQN